ncbi:MAG: MarR family winged helix-turn-helix transcriptional regulator [Hyphomicrobiales bacterium]
MSETDLKPTESVAVLALLKRATQYGTQVFGDVTAKSGVTPRQFAVLATVEENDGISQTALSARTGIDRSTLAELVARLIAQGYLQRRRTRDDGRTNALRTTPAGRRVLKAAEPGARETDEQLIAAVPARYRKGFVEGLAALAAKLQATNGDARPAQVKAAGNARPRSEGAARPRPPQE